MWTPSPGTGERSEAKTLNESNPALFGDDGSEVATAKVGSVRIALSIDPPFQKYILIERSKARAAELQKAKGRFPRLG